jgi:hypothetical protein
MPKGKAEAETLSERESQLIDEVAGLQKLVATLEHELETEKYKRKQREIELQRVTRKYIMEKNK